MHTLISLCVCVRGQWQCDGPMTLSSHMANHVEQWAGRHGTGGGEMWSGLENVILFNIDAVFWKDVNLANTLCSQLLNKQMSGNTLVIVLSLSVCSCGFTESVMKLHLFCMHFLKQRQSHPLLLSQGRSMHSILAARQIVNIRRTFQRKEMNVSQ